MELFALLKKNVILTCFNPEIPIVLHCPHQISHREVRLGLSIADEIIPSSRKDQSLWATENRQGPLSRGNRIIWTGFPKREQGPEPGTSIASEKSTF